MTPAINHALAAGCALLLSGCASVEPYEPPPEIQRIDQLAALELSDQGTYDPQRFEQSVDALGGTELTTLLAELADSSFDLQQAYARVQQASAGLRLATAGRQPLLSYSVSAGAARNQDFLTQEAEWDESYSAALSAQWDVDLFGNLRAAEKAANFRLRASALSAQRLHQSLSAQLTQAYIAAWALRERAAVQQELADSFEKTASLTEKRYRDGSRQVSALELQITRQNALAAQANVPEIEAQYDAQLFIIDALLARPAGTTRLLFPDMALGKALPSMPVGLPTNLLRRRADVAAAELQLLAAYSDIDSAAAQTKPSLSLSGSLSQNSNSISDIFNADRLLANLLANLTGPIFDAGRLRANLKLARANRDEQGASYAQTAFAAFTEVKNALRFEHAFQKKFTLLEQTLAAAELSDRVASERFVGGQTTLLNVLETRRALFNSRQNLIATQQQLFQTRADLLLASGGNWSVTEANGSLADEADRLPNHKSPLANEKVAQND